MNILSFSLVVFLLFDQLLALVGSFSSGFGLVIFLLTIAISAIPKLIKENNLIGVLKRCVRPSNALPPLLIIAYSVIGASNAPCHGYRLFSLATVLLAIISWKFVHEYVSSVMIEYVIEPKHALVGLIIIYLCLCLAVSDFDLYSKLQHLPTNRPSGLYLEPSHLILYASPLMFTVVSNKETRVFGVLLSTFIFVLAFTVTYFTLTILVMFCYLIHQLFSKSRLVNNKKNLWFMFLAMTIFALTLNSQTLKERLSDSGGASAAEGMALRNFSTLVYLNGWLLAKSTIQNTSGLGLGLGAMGCSDIINNHEQTLSAEVKKYSGNSGGKIICARDGSFLASKITSELGLLGVFILGFIAFQLIIILLKMLNYEFDLVVVGSICLLLTLLFIRGLPYFTAPVLFCFISIINHLKKFR